MPRMLKELGYATACFGKWHLGTVPSLAAPAQGFDEFFGHRQIVEVDCPGLTSPVLARFAWRRLPRPVLPLDTDVSWSPP